MKESTFQCLANTPTGRCTRYGNGGLCDAHALERKIDMRTAQAALIVVTKVGVKEFRYNEKTECFEVLTNP